MDARKEPCEQAAPWMCSVAGQEFKTSHQSTQGASVPLSSDWNLVDAGHMGLFQLPLVTILVVINLWGCDDSLRWETSCSVGDAVRLSL